MTVFASQIGFTVIECSQCHVSFGLSDSFIRRRQSDRKTFYCPNGHTQWYPGETDKDKAQRLAGQLDMERTRRAGVERKLEYQMRARKAVSTRLRKTKVRVGHGVCPCCNRTFKALADHMATKHPGYATEVEA